MFYAWDSLVNRLVYIPNENRVRKLTVNECYRIMGFPDNFIRSNSIAEQYKQIGNSVAIPIVKAIVMVAKNKIHKYNPSIYYILSYYGVKEEDKEENNRIVNKIKEEHGCQVIINGLLPTIKYYLRLMDSLEEFVNSYSNLVQNNTELLKTHKEV